MHLLISTVGFSLVICAAACTPRLQASGPVAGYRYTVSLRRLNAQNRLRVRVDLPAALAKSAVFALPKLVPGIYGRLNFGQYVADLQAFDRRGRPLAVSRQDTNSWRIAAARQLHHLTYTVAATWPEFRTAKGHQPSFYRSAGSSYHPDSAFVLNYATFAGYLVGQADRPFEVRFAKPTGFYGASYLTPRPLNDTTDVVQAPTYAELVDAPVLYARPDTAWLRVGNARVLVAYYSPGSHPPQAPALASSLRTMLEAQRAYLGGTLPVEKYSFLVYHTLGPPAMRVGDGLEHSHSTLCLLESPDRTALSGFVRHLAAHEFFHIVTPLNLHAEQIEHYDFQQPTFSRHLWLYEGLTEYETIHLPIRQHLETLPEFLAVLSDKVRDLRKYDDYLSLTQLSQQVLTRQDQFYNFYVKGALFNLCLDVRLRELSGGKLGTQQLTQALLQRYGPHHPFADAQLFDELTQLTYPELRAFFRDYLEHGQPLPLATTLAKVGLTLDAASGTVAAAASPTPAQLALRQAWLGQ